MVDQVVTTAEAAAILGVTPRAVRYFVKSGRLEAYKTDPFSQAHSNYRISRASIDAFIAARRASGKLHREPPA